MRRQAPMSCSSRFGRLGGSYTLCYYSPMLRSLLTLLACPDCGANIVAKSELKTDDSSLTEATLACESCSATFPVERGIPRMMPRAILDEQKGEIQARDAQVKQYDANTFLNIFGRFEIPMTLKELDLHANDSFLEAGCGTGRMTQIFAARCKAQVSVDFSFASLLVNQEKLKRAGMTNVHLIQADICNLPLRTAIFDRAVSCQVLEHVPSDDARRKAVASIAETLKPSAVAVISAYQHSPLMASKSGMHDGGIPFFRFTKSEFRELLSTQFQVQSITGALVYLYLATCTKLTN